MRRDYSAAGGLVHTALEVVGQGAVASYPSDCMALTAVLGMVVALLGDSDSGSTYCYYCTSAVPEPEWLGYIGQGARQYYTVLEQRDALDLCEPGPVQLVQLARPALFAYSEPQLAVVAASLVQEIG